MELLEDIRFYNRTGKIPTQVIREAALQDGLFDCVLEEGGENTPERVDVLNKINNDTYIKNNYKAFLEELKRNKRAEFLTPYTVQDFINGKVQTYQVPGYEIGFALKPMANGDMDIISVHNNTNIGGIGEALIDSAIRLGGTTLDHFDGYLSDFYKKKGFEEKERMKWNDAYAPKNWNYNNGRPDVVLRRLTRK
jgi:hypothetical protein